MATRYPKAIVASQAPSSSDFLRRGLPCLVGLILALLPAEACSKRDSESERQNPPSRTDRAAAQARGLANANAMVENAARCEPGAGDPNLVACKRACELNHSNSCANWAAIVAPQDEKMALELYERACKGGSGIGCEGAAALIEASGGDAVPVYRNARRYHRIHCNQGYARSCAQLASLLGSTKGGPASADAARVFLDRACRLGDDLSCEAANNP